MSRKALVPQNMFRSSTDPVSPTPKSGDVYLNSISGLLRAYSGSAWADLPYPVTASAIAPATPVLAMVWLDTSSPGIDPTATQLSGRNGIANGGMIVAQRGVTGAGSTNATTGRSGLDRWMIYRNAFTAGCTWTQVATASVGLAGYASSLRVQRDSGNASTQACVALQTFETENSVKYRGRSVSLSFWARCGANYSPTSSLLNVNLTSGTGSTEENFTSTFTGALAEINTNVTLTTSWQRIVVTDALLSSSLTQIAVVFSSSPVGTAGTNDWFEITGVQLEDGLVPTPFEATGIALETLRCQRHYWRYTGSVSERVGAGVFSSATNAAVYVQYPVTMRSAPTLAVSAAGILTAQGSGAFVGTAIATGGTVSVSGAQVNITVAAATAGQACLGYINASGWISFTAELA